jgi:hypothetical protein
MSSHFQVLGDVLSLGKKTLAAVPAENLETYTNLSVFLIGFLFIFRAHCFPEYVVFDGVFAALRYILENSSKLLDRHVQRIFQILERSYLLPICCNVVANLLICSACGGKPLLYVNMFFEAVVTSINRKELCSLLSRENGFSSMRILCVQGLAILLLELADWQLLTSSRTGWSFVGLVALILHFVSKQLDADDHHRYIRAELQNVQLRKDFFRASPEFANLASSGYVRDELMNTALMNTALNAEESAAELQALMGMYVEFVYGWLPYASRVQQLNNTIGNWRRELGHFDVVEVLRSRLGALPKDFSTGHFKATNLTNLTLRVKENQKIIGRFLFSATVAFLMWAMWPDKGQVTSWGMWENIHKGWLEVVELDNPFRISHILVTGVVLCGFNEYCCAYNEGHTVLPQLDGCDELIGVKSIQMFKWLRIDLGAYLLSDDRESERDDYAFALASLFCCDRGESSNRMDSAEKAVQQITDFDALCCMLKHLLRIPCGEEEGASENSTVAVDGIVTRILDIMGNNLTDTQVQLLSRENIQILSREKITTAVHGIVDCTLSGMESNPADTRIHLQGCKRLLCLAKNADNFGGIKLIFAAREDGITCILSAMRNHSEENIQLMGCEFLALYCRNQNRRSFLRSLRSDAIERVKVAMETGTTCQVQHQGCRALAELFRFFEGSRELPTRCATLILQALSDHSTNANVQIYGCRALCSIGAASANYFDIEHIEQIFDRIINILSRERTFPSSSHQTAGRQLQLIAEAIKVLCTVSIGPGNPHLDLLATLIQENQQQPTLICVIKYVLLFEQSALPHGFRGHSLFIVANLLTRDDDAQELHRLL